MSPSNWFRDFMTAAGADFSAGRPPHKAPIGPPMTLANMRKNGVRCIRIECLTYLCLNRATMNVDNYPGDLPVKSFERRMRCTRCHGMRVDVRPLW